MHHIEKQLMLVAVFKKINLIKLIVILANNGKYKTK